MTDIVVDRLNIRGPAGRRLAGIAARLLPDALGEALGDLADVELGRLQVRLDLDPAEYDERTIAVLWANAIRASALEAGARPAVPPPISRRSSPPTTTGVVGSVPSSIHSRATAGGGESITDIAEAAAAWLRAGAPPSAVPLALLAMVNPGLAREVAGRLGPAAARRLVAHLTGLRHPRLPSAATAARVRGGSRAARDVVRRADSGDRRAQSADQSTPPEPGLSHEDAVGLASCAASLRELAVTATASGATVNLGLVTRVGGVVLLYPWLADLCRDALIDWSGPLPAGWDPDGTHPAVVDVRRRVLARLADPADPTLVDDPLVCLLAGAPAAGVPRPLDPTDPRSAWMDHRAERLLRGFAALLPGFGGSSPPFVRSAWLRRDGLIGSVEAIVRITAVALPLDIVLARLPYPIGLIRLPWTPPMSVTLGR